MLRCLRFNCSYTLLALLMTTASTRSQAAPFVPGTGEFLADCCDDFEDASWSYKYNHPKSSHEQDERQRSPGGRSSNGLWHEGGKRGTPDVVKRITTPPGGIEGSTGALMFATKHAGIPGKVTNEQQQDDLLMLFDRRLGRPIPVSWRPSCTVRVYLPPFDQWENRTGASFGMRADCVGKGPDGNEPYWPGMFFLFRQANGKSVKEDAAKLTVRANHRGQDVRSHDATEPGWWTLGMSFTPDGQIHYYARAGVEDLTAEDFILSSYPYGYKAITFNNFFFNVANWDNGRAWSTPWVIDDPKIFVIPPQGQTVAQLYRIKKKPQQRQGVARNQNQPMRQPNSNSRSANSQQRVRSQR